MLKKIFPASLTLLLAGCMAGGALSGMGNAAMLGNVIGAVAGAGAQNTPAAQQQAYGQAYGQQPYTQPYAQPYGQQAYAQPYIQPYGQQAYAQPQAYPQNQAAGILGAAGGQGGLNVIIRDVLANQCGIYLGSQPVWQSARAALGNQAQYWEGQICQCASQEALNSMTAEQLAQLGMSASGGQAAIGQAAVGLLAQTAMTCLQRLSPQLMPAGR